MNLLAPRKQTILKHSLAFNSESFDYEASHEKIYPMKTIGYGQHI